MDFSTCAKENKKNRKKKEKKRKQIIADINYYSQNQYDNNIYELLPYYVPELNNIFSGGFIKRNIGTLKGNVMRRHQSQTCLNQTYFNQNYSGKKYGPVTSYGFICLRKINNKIDLLLVQKKYTHGFKDLVGGKYSINNPQYIKSLIKNTTQEEKTKLYTRNFDELWSMIWYEPLSQNFIMTKYEFAKEKFMKLKENYGEYFHTLTHAELEWEFPKGKKEKNETTLECAQRELEEETNINIEDYRHLPKIYAFDEKFKGGDGREYKHVYYLCVIANSDNISINPNNLRQSAEINDLGFFTFTEALIKFENHSGKLNILAKIRDIVNEKYPKFAEISDINSENIDEIL